MSDAGSGSAPVFDTTDATFASDVIERSRELPVVVDFWAPWCGPCRFLGPVLEELVEGEFRDQLVLAKVDVDHNQKTATAYRIQGIPAVKIFRDGDVVQEFVGALPEAELRAVLSSVVPSQADLLAVEAQARLAAGDLDAAEAAVTTALADDTHHAGALLVRGEILSARGDYEQARRSFEMVAGQPELEREAERLLALLEIRHRADAVTRPQEELEAAADDVAARFDLALVLASRGEFRAALNHLLWVVEKDRGFGDDAGRKTMLTIFTAVGTRSELADEYRSKLAQLL